MKTKNKKEDVVNKDQNQVYWMPIGMCLGISFGCVLGSVFNNMSIWMCFGLSIGLLFGLVIDQLGKKQK